MSLDRQRIGVGVSGIASVSTSWETTLPALEGDACDTPPPVTGCTCCISGMFSRAETLSNREIIRVAVLPALRAHVYRTT